jgi:sec-independent protein translocase protein TatC
LSSEELLTFREHLSELKRRLKLAFISFALFLGIFILAPADIADIVHLNITGTYVSFVKVFFDRIKQDTLPVGWTLIANHLNEPLEVFIVGCIILALAFNTPIFAYEIFRFVHPALNVKERNLLYPFVGATTGLFAVGTIFGYFILAKFLITALTPFFIITNSGFYIDVADFYFIIFLVIFFSGFGFTIPVYVFMLIRFGIIEQAFFRRHRIIIWFITYVLTALITPDGGPLLDLFLFIPVIVLLESSVFLAGFTRRRAMKDKEGPPPTEAPETAQITQQVPVCKFCSTPLDPSSPFCAKCGRSNG